MPKVLILAYYFPPLGMGGTQRAAKFAKYLSEFGWTPVVLTVQDVAYYARDARLLDDVRGIEVIRTGSADPQRLLFKLKGDSSASPSGPPGRLARTVNGLFVPDTKILWLPFVLARAWRLLKQQRVDVIFTTSPPHSAQLGGWLLRRLSGLPWVADFRDPWAGGEFQPNRGRWHRAVDAALQRSVLRHADTVIAVSVGLGQRLVAAEPSVREKLVVIPNGYDEVDFCSETAAPSALFTFTFCGSLTACRGLQTLLAAAGELRQHHGLPPWRLRLLGAPVHPEAVSWIREAAGLGAVEATGYLPHDRAIAEMLAADVLVYLVPDHASSGHIPGKTFEYLRAGKPILAIGPEVEGMQILRKHLPVVSCDSADTRAIVQAMTHFMVGPGPASGVRGSIDCYSRREQTRRLAEILSLSSSPGKEVN